MTYVRTPFRRRYAAGLAIGFALMASGSAGCQGGADGDGDSADFVVIDDETTPAEKEALEAARPFVVALANRKYDEAYAQLSSHAKQRMSDHQFVAPLGDQPTENERTIDKPTAAQFAAEMKKVEDRYGAPQAVSMLYAESSDPKILSGKGTGELGSELEVDMAIGGITDTVPVNLRRAGLRGQIQTRLKPAELRQLAEEFGKSVAEIEADDEMRPYFNLLLVMVEEEGKLKVGYFEVRPPSILD